MSTVTSSIDWPLLLLAAVPLVWLLAWRNRARTGRARMIGATVLRSAALVAIVVALLRPALHRISEEVSVVYALDVSSSVSRRFLDEALEWIARVDKDHKAAQSRFVVFADRPKLLGSLAEVRALNLANEDAGASRNDLIRQ